MKKTTILSVGGALAVLLVQLVLAASNVLLATTNAQASDRPIQGIDILVKKTSGPHKIQVQTDSAGSFSLGNLPPGDYTLEIDPERLQRAIDRLNPKGGKQRIAILVGVLFPVQANSRNSRQQTLASKEFDVGRGPISMNFTVVPVVGDWDGDGRARRATPGDGPTLNGSFTPNPRMTVNGDWSRTKTSNSRDGSFTPNARLTVNGDPSRRKTGDAPTPSRSTPGYGRSGGQGGGEYYGRGTAGTAECRGTITLVR